MAVTAQIIASSRSISGTTITTYELEYPRIIHGELLTHRMFSKNSASSRAIPVSKVLELVRTEPAKPVHWGKNQPGMQAFEEHFELVKGSYSADEWWEMAAGWAAYFSEGLSEAGYHKQVANRLTETFQHMKVVLTSTTFDNWFNLRYHEAADPTIHLLAACMLEAWKDNKPFILLPGEWHTPYYQEGYWVDSGDGIDIHGNTLDQALKISSSCCAQVSYRKLDGSIDKAYDIYGKLVDSEPVHASPTEHQATPMDDPKWGFEASKAEGYIWQAGKTHMDRHGDFWSGNFKHWIQHRQLIPNNVCNNFNYDEA